MEKFDYERLQNTIINYKGIEIKRSENMQDMNYMIIMKKLSIKN